MVSPLSKILTSMAQNLKPATSGNPALEKAIASLKDYKSACEWVTERGLAEFDAIIEDDTKEVIDTLFRTSAGVMDEEFREMAMRCMDESVEHKIEQIIDAKEFDPKKIAFLLKNQSGAAIFALFDAYNWSDAQAASIIRNMEDEGLKDSLIARYIQGGRDLVEFADIPEPNHLNAANGGDLAGDLNVQDRFGFTPLHYAVFYNQKKAERELRAAGADSAIVDRHGKTAGDYKSEMREQEQERVSRIYQNSEQFREAAKIHRKDWKLRDSYLFIPMGSETWFYPLTKDFPIGSGTYAANFELTGYGPPLVRGKLRLGTTLQRVDKWEDFQEKCDSPFVLRYHFIVYESQSKKHPGFLKIVKVAQKMDGDLHGLKVQSKAELYDVLRQIILGFKAINDAGYVHYDAKANNVFFSRSGGRLQVKVADIDFVRPKESLAVNSAENKGWYPPEIKEWNYKDIDPDKVDVFGIGSIFLVVLYKSEIDEVKPFKNEIKAAYNALNGAKNWMDYTDSLRNLEEMAKKPEAPAILSVVRRMVDPDPSSRPSFEELVALSL